MWSHWPRLALVCLALMPGRAALAQDAPCQKYTLPNGMTVILHEDHSLPVATVNIWYRVGAQDEPPGRSGFAHLFEHLMFMGTRRVPGNQFDVLMETGGGANNASTDLHRTNYYSWGPSRLLPTLLWLDADRLEDMGLQMTQDKLDKQRDVVRNELRQTVENAPYGKASEALWKLLYPPNHPYSNGVIGTHEDLEAANVANVKDFFANFYVPRNASLVVAGDFDSALIRPLVDRLFGDLPGGQPVSRKYAPPTDPIPVRLDGVKRFTAIDKVELPKIEYSYHGPVAFGPGDAEMQLAASVLAGGKSSRLYRRLVVEEKVASEVSASQQGFPLGGLFQISIMAAPTADLDRVERLADEVIAAFLAEGPSVEELERQKATIELNILSSLQSVERKADRLNEYEYYWGEPDSFKRDLERYRAATPALVREWSVRTITPAARVVIRVLPQEPVRASAARDTRPADANAAAFAMPAMRSFTLGNGLKVLVCPRADLPLVSMRLLLQPGGYLDRAESKGLTSITAQMLGEGAGDLDARAFADAVQAIGATFASSADRESVSVSATVLKRNLDRAASLLGDAVLRPRFDASEWERVRRITVDEIRQALEAPPVIAATVGERLFFGDDEPAGWPVRGTEKSVAAMSLDSVRETHARVARPGYATLMIAGDVTPEAAQRLAERTFGGWAAGPAATPAAPGAPAGKAEGPRVVIVDRPGATQTTIRFVGPGVPLRDDSRVTRRLLNTILGGSFTSRLNQNLREDHGYTYGARSAQDMGVFAGTVTAGASVKSAVTGAALVEFFKEFDRLRAGDVTDAEAAKARETVRNDTVRGFAGLAGLLNAAEERLTCGLPLESIASDLAAMGSVGAKELNVGAKRMLAFESGVLVLVGDRTTIEQALKTPGLPALPSAREYRTDGTPK
ncbi:MAG: insulinase family protein [Phycisphaerae bacterium]|nr:insulinase family protein [Phycisphaerae bacterium]